jgi:NAD-specific glutamate dehydrogenase
MTPMERTRYLRGYYATAQAEDLAQYEEAALAAIAWSHLAFAHKRRKGRALVRVFNPTLRENGFTSPHTIVEIVNDDMPFLVDQSCHRSAQSRDALPDTPRLFGEAGPRRAAP